MNSKKTKITALKMAALITKCFAAAGFIVGIVLIEYFTSIMPTLLTFLACLAISLVLGFGFSTIYGLLLYQIEILNPEKY